MVNENDYLSPLRSDEDKAWERELFAPADPFSHSAQREEDPSQEPANEGRNVGAETKEAGKTARKTSGRDSSRVSSKRAPSGSTVSSRYSGSASSGRYGGSTSSSSRAGSAYYGSSGESGSFAGVKDLLQPHSRQAGKRSILAMFLLTAITACVITAASFFIIRTDFFRNNPDFPDLPGYFFGGDDDYENAYPDGHILTEYGYDSFLFGFK